MKVPDFSKKFIKKQQQQKTADDEKHAKLPSRQIVNIIFSVVDWKRKELSWESEKLFKETGLKDNLTWKFTEQRAFKELHLLDCVFVQNAPIVWLFAPLLFMLLLSSVYLFYSNLYLSKNSFRNTIWVPNSLILDQDRRSAGPDLGLKCLQRLSTDHKSRQ